MKKITTIILLCLLVTGFAQSQTKVTISLTNPKIVNNMFKFDAQLTAADLINLPNYSVYLKLLVDGVVTRPFSAVTLGPQ